MAKAELHAVEVANPSTEEKWHTVDDAFIRAVVSNLRGEMIRMANNENLKPVRTKSEARERGRAGGKASGEARRKRADFRKTLNALLTAEIDSPEWNPLLESLGLDPTLEAAINMAMIKEALAGNVKAYEAVARYAGQSGQTAADDEEQRIRTDRAKRAMDQEVGDTDNQNDNIQSFLKAMRPTEEDLAGLFEEDEKMPKRKKRPAKFNFKPFSPQQQRLIHWWRPMIRASENNYVIADGSIRSGKTIACIIGFLTWSQEMFSGESFYPGRKDDGSTEEECGQTDAADVGSMGMAI